MTYVITEPCIDLKDASCVDVCPVDCIYTTDADNMYYIHPDECIDCGACESVCPVSAIFPEDAVPDKWKHFIAFCFSLLARPRAHTPDTASGDLADPLRSSRAP
jgi:ferredoxin